MLHESVKRDNRHERTRQHTPSATGLSTDRTGDMQSLLNLLAADVQWQVPEMEHVPFAGTWQGHAGIKQFFFTVAEVQETIEFEPQEFIAQEDKMVVLGRFVMRIKATGNTVRSA